MNKLIYLLLILIFAETGSMLFAQDELEALLEEEIGEVKEEVIGTFLSTYVLNNQSVEMLNKNGLNFRISHKFDYLNTGSENFYGFDHSSAYMGFEFAPADWLNVGIGRATLYESFNAQIKIRVLQQSKGKANIPVTMVFYGEMDYYTGEYTNEELDAYWKGRISYTSQMLLARKFGNSFAIQLMPTWMHRNLVKTKEDKNDIFALGIGGTYRLFKRLRFNAEYFLTQEHNTSEGEYYSPLALGICYQTSRHAFEVFATNARAITTNNLIGVTTGNFWEGDICIGFNVSIIFSVKR